MKKTARIVRRASLSAVFGVAMIVPAEFARSDDGPAATQPATSQPAASQPAGPEAIPLGENLLEGLNLKPGFDALHLKVYGWVEQGFTVNMDNPSNRINTLRVFDDRSNDYRFNQLMVNLERPLTDGNGFDIGGKIELLYGSDSRFTHAAGLADHIDDHTVQFDPLQFYALIRIPLGNGVTIKAGKYVTTIGFESIDAPANALYSHSFLFGFAEPFTHTGFELDYPITDKLNVYYGLVEGWDVWKDNNSTLSHMTGLAWTISDKASANVNLMFGPERRNENTDYRSLIDFYATYKWTDKLATSINIDFGNESGTKVAGATGNNWYGVAAYGTYTLLPEVAATVRAEYFRDQTASRLGFTGEVIELTAGLDIHPWKKFWNLRVRPEVRWDHALGDTPFDAHGRGNQATVGGDVIISF